MTTLAIDFYISMRSPYSYLVTPRLATLTETYDVEITARPVYAIAARDPDWFKSLNPLWLPYFLIDQQRTAEFLGVPFALPRPDPIVQDLATGTIAADQPYIRGLTRLAAAQKLSPVIGRKEEMRTLARILLQKRKSNAILVGEAGVGKTGIVEGIAQRIVGPKPPRGLEGNGRSPEAGSVEDVGLAERSRGVLGVK